MTAIVAWARLTHHAQRRRTAARELQACAPERWSAIAHSRGERVVDRSAEALGKGHLGLVAELAPRQTDVGDRVADVTRADGFVYGGNVSASSVADACGKLVERDALTARDVVD